MDEKKINHIETSSRASSAANFNSIDIDLRSNFSIKMQNASSNLILGMKVYRRNSNSVIYSKEVQRFSVVYFGM